MTLYLSWPDADQLKLIAQAAIDVLQKRSGAYFPQFSSATAAVTPMDAIEVTPVAPALATRLSPLFRVLIGLVAGIALAFLAEYLDPTIRTRRDAELLGYPIVGELPQR
jgi:capsular polysaccharide biosynthesis protein